MMKLANGWALTTVGEVTQPVATTSPADRPNTEFRYLDISSIDNQASRITNPKTYLGREAPSRARQVVAENDTLFSTVRTYLKNIAMVPKNLDGQVASTGFAVLRPAPVIEPGFLFHYTLTAGFLNLLGELQRGSSYPAVRDEDVRAQPILLPPLAEQRRIVAKIEELFSELDKGLENLRQARAQLAVYRQALLKHAFAGQLTAAWRATHAAQLESAAQLLARIRTQREARYQRQLADWRRTMVAWQKTSEGPKPKQPAEPKSVTPLNSNAEASDLPAAWFEVAVGDILIGKPTNGRSVTNRSGGFKVLRLTSLKNGTIDLSENKEGDWNEPEAKPYILKCGDFLISRGNGSLRLVGRGGLVKDNLPIAYPDTMVRMVVDPLAFDFRLFCMLWNSEVFRRQIESSARTTAGIYKINQSVISKFGFPLIPLPEQAALVAMLESQLPEISRLEADIETNLQKAEALRQAILKKAFAGELVPPDPNDEPAAALLARIRAARAAAAFPKPARRTKAPCSSA